MEPPLVIKGIPTMFGEVSERRVTFAIDTSGSMFTSLDSIKEHLLETLLKHADREGETQFNVIEFNSEVVRWADKMVVCTPDTVSVAAGWINALQPKSGTNMLDALLTSFSDDLCQAIYLVTDGYPDQDDDEILDHVAYIARDRPVHCLYVSTNQLPDTRALRLLEDIAFETYGSLQIVKVTSHGSIDRVTPVFRATHKHEKVVRSKDGTLHPDAPRCSVTASLVGDPLSDPAFVAPSYVYDRLSGSMMPFYHPYHHWMWWAGGLPWYPSHPMVPFKSWSRFRPSRAWIRGKDHLHAVDDPGLTPSGGLLLIGRPVLARRDEDGHFYKGTVKSEVTADQFLVEFGPLEHGEFKDTEYQKTSVFDIIGLDDALRHIILPGDNVLAPDENCEKYKPATVLDGVEKRDRKGPSEDKELSVFFVDGNGSSYTVPLGQAVWIPKKVFERLSLESKMTRDAVEDLKTVEGYPEDSLPGYVTSGVERWPKEYEVVKPLNLKGQPVIMDNLHPACRLPIYPAFTSYASDKYSKTASREVPGSDLTAAELQEKVQQQLSDRTTVEEEVKEDLEEDKTPTTVDVGVGTPRRLMRRVQQQRRPPWRYWHGGIPEAESSQDFEMFKPTGWGDSVEHRRRHTGSWTNPSFSYVDHMARNKYDKETLDLALREQHLRDHRPPACLTKQGPGCELSSALGRHQLIDEERARKRDCYRRSSANARLFMHESRIEELQRKAEQRDEFRRGMRSAQLAHERTRDAEIAEIVDATRQYKQELASCIRGRSAASREEEAAREERRLEGIRERALLRDRAVEQRLQRESEMAAKVELARAQRDAVRHELMNQRLVAEGQI